MVLENTVAAGFSKFKTVSFNPELLNILQRLFIVLNHFIDWENSRHSTTPPLVPREMTSEKRAQKFHTGDVSLFQIWVLLLIGCSKFPSRHDQSETSVWNFRSRYPDIILRWNHGDGVAKCCLRLIHIELWVIIRFTSVGDKYWLLFWLQLI